MPQRAVLEDSRAGPGLLVASAAHLPVSCAASVGLNWPAPGTDRRLQQAVQHLIEAACLFAVAVGAVLQILAVRVIGSLSFTPFQRIVAFRFQGLPRARWPKIHVLLAHLLSDSNAAPSSVPTVSAPFSASFMLPVPEASLPAVEICLRYPPPGSVFLLRRYTIVRQEDHLQLIADSSLLECFRYFH